MTIITSSGSGTGLYLLGNRRDLRGDYGRLGLRLQTFDEWQASGGQPR